MAHYVLGLMKVTDAALMDARMGDFVSLVRASVARYGGRFILEGEVVESLEGAVDGEGGSVIEFDDADAARRWFESPEYSEARALRERFGTAFHVLMRDFAEGGTT